MTTKGTRRVLVGLLAVAAWAASPPPSARAAGAPDAYAPAAECARCHSSIHVYWSESEHARAATKPAFLESLRSATAAASDPDAVRRGCVSCHAPNALVSGDHALVKPLTREGVSCDFCHTVADVDLGRRGDPFTLAPGPVKRGPLEYASSPAHQTLYSPLHKASALLCAGCHEMANAHGLGVLTTYSEWKAGPYAEMGKTCQECHMPLVPGRTVKEGFDSAQRRVNLHWMSGGTLASRLAGGLQLRIESAEVGASTAQVQVAVVNRGVGHAAPGGLSSKSLVLSVGVDGGSGELAPRLDRFFRRVLKDSQGRGIETVAGEFLDAASVSEDTRLKPRETRTERFTLPLAPTWRAIVARLEYHDASDPQAPPTVTLVAEARHERGR